MYETMLTGIDRREHFADSTRGMDVLEPCRSYTFVCSVSCRMLAFKKNEIKVGPVGIEGKSITID